MPKTIHSDPGSNPPFDLTISDGTPILYADGFSQLNLGWPNSRLVFHNVESPATAETSEARTCPFQLTLPTAVLLQLCATVMGIAATNSEQLKNVTVQYQSHFLANLPKAAPRKT